MKSTSAEDYLEVGPLEADAFTQAFCRGLAAQMSAYGRVFLPVLGRGRQRHLPQRNYCLRGRDLQAPRQTIWQFEGPSQLDWLDAAVTYPLEDIDDWMVLFRSSDLPPSLASTLRPPLVPRLRKTLSARSWSIVDVCQGSEGNLEFTEFLELIGRHRWVRLDHRTDTGIFAIERWQDRKLKTRVQLELDAQLQTNISADYPPVPSPLLFDDAWKAPRDEALAISIADELDDIYANLRRLVKHHFWIELDGLGPLLFWRDWPDELCEFDEKEDGPSLDLATQMAADLNLEVEETASRLVAWLGRCATLPRCDIPFFGELRSTLLPDLRLEFPDTSRDSLAIPGGPLHVAVTSASSS